MRGLIAEFEIRRKRPGDGARPLRGPCVQHAVFSGCCNACCAILHANHMNCASCAPWVAIFVLAALAALACCVPRVQFHVQTALATRALASVPVAYAASMRVRVRVRLTLVGPRLCVASPARVSCSLRIFRCIGVCIFLASACNLYNQTKRDAVACANARGS